MSRRLCILTIALAAAAGTAAPAAQSDLDAFMARVLERRDENWKKLQQYVLDEEETLQITGPDGGRLYGFVREYTWFPRDGVFIRSPLRADGVAIGEDERRRAEAEWLENERRQEQRRAERRARQRGDSGTDSGPGDAGAADGPQAPETVQDAVRQSIEPQFVSSAYFLRFRFEPGRYGLVGRETLLDREVLRIEYYPTQLFRGGRTRPNRRLRERDDQIEEKMNKVALVTLWVEPSAHQILQYEFSNVDLDFLPGRQLVRVDEISASMRMTQPSPDVWLPETVAVRFRMTLATGDVAGRYDVRYHDYRLASVTTRIR